MNNEYGRFYYDRGELRIEITPLGSGHGTNNSVTSNVVTLFATLKQIRIKEYTNVSLRKAGVAEAQPDISFYIGSEFRFPPINNSPIDINEFGSPALVIEIAILEEALRRSQTEDDGQINRWLIQLFS
jgi:Uma2 family endonuclease